MLLGSDPTPLPAANVAEQLIAVTIVIATLASSAI
jgi:hypothetical protein